MCLELQPVVHQCESSTMCCSYPHPMFLILGQNSFIPLPETHTSPRPSLTLFQIQGSWYPRFGCNNTGHCQLLLTVCSTMSHWTLVAEFRASDKTYSNKSLIIAPKAVNLWPAETGVIVFCFFRIQSCNPLDLLVHLKGLCPRITSTKDNTYYWLPTRYSKSSQK